MGTNVVPPRSRMDRAVLLRRELGLEAERGDLDRSGRLSVMRKCDTDPTGATVRPVAGAMVGAAVIAPLRTDHLVVRESSAPVHERVGS